MGKIALPPLQKESDTPDSITVAEEEDFINFVIHQLEEGLIATEKYVKKLSRKLLLEVIILAALLDFIYNVRNIIARSF